MKQLQATVTLIGLRFILFAYNHCVCNQQSTLNKLMCVNTGLGVSKDPAEKTEFSKNSEAI